MGLAQTHGPSEKKIHDTDVVRGGLTNQPTIWIFFFYFFIFLCVFWAFHDIAVLRPKKILFWRKFSDKKKKKKNFSLPESRKKFYCVFGRFMTLRFQKHKKKKIRFSEALTNQLTHPRVADFFFR